MMGQSISMFNLTPAELELVKRALSDAAAGKPAVELSEWGPKIQPLATSRSAAVAVKEKASSAAYLAKCAAEPGAVKTESGLVLPGGKSRNRRIAQGNGHGEGPLSRHFGERYLSSTVPTNATSRPVPSQRRDQMLDRRRAAHEVGGKSTLVCPSDLAYGDQGRPSIPGGATLTFDIELLDIVPAK
jgi:FKBP-type peptidyl-prolyl cis-trans isomerase